MKTPTKLRLTKWQWAGAALAATFILMSFVVDRYWLWLRAQAWYIRHLNGVSYMGKVIPVPRGMVRIRESGSGSDEAFFVEIPPTTQGAKKRGEWDMYFCPGRLPNETPQDAIKRVATNLRALATKTGKAIGPAFEVETQEGKGWCYTTDVVPGRYISTTCLLFNAQWSATYAGPPSNENAFFEVVAGIHDAKK